jgi:hypothetical protein
MKKALPWSSMVSVVHPALRAKYSDQLTGGSGTGTINTRKKR